MDITESLIPEEEAASEQETEEKPKKKRNFSSIFKFVGRGVRLLAILSTVVSKAFMAYIIFAPDELPKPFYLQYQYRIEAAAKSEESDEDTEDSSETNGILSKLPLIGAGEAEAASEETMEVSAEDRVHSIVDVASLVPGEGFMFNTGTKIVNLAEPTGRRYIRINTVIEFAYIEPMVEEDSSADHSEESASPAPTFRDELNARLPIINDALITLLSSKTFESIYTSEGKEILRQEI